MKKYDFEKAKALITENEKLLSEASLGMYEDWSWTADPVWGNGKFIKKLEAGTTIAGINESRWATPTLRLNFLDGDEKMIPCFTGDSVRPEGRFMGANGCISGPCQDSLPPLESAI